MVPEVTGHQVSGTLLPQYSESHTKSQVLVIGGQMTFRLACCEIAMHAGYGASEVKSSGESLKTIRQGGIDIALVNLGTSTEEYCGFIAEARRSRPDLAIILMGAFFTIRGSIAAIQNGAHDILLKPFEAEELITRLKQAEKQRASRLADIRLKDQSKVASNDGAIIGHSANMQAIRRLCAQMAMSTHPALIEGESGSGKEFIARLIHATGCQASGTFVSVDCMLDENTRGNQVSHRGNNLATWENALPKWLAEAVQGTLFLSDVDKLHVDTQAALLRLFKERTDKESGSAKLLQKKVRILAGTSRDLAIMVGKGHFRKDLYNHLNIVTLRIPALRDRQSDIPALAAHFLARATRGRESTYEISSAALHSMVDYPWPGNVRELEQTMERGAIVSSGPVLELHDLSSPLVNFASQKTIWSASPRYPHLHDVDEDQCFEPISWSDRERRAIVTTFNALHGNRRMTARVLGIGYATLSRKLTEYKTGIQKIST